LPARVIWVADDGTGDFTTVQAALDSITDATATKPYLIRIAPGVYETATRITTKDHVDIEGSGQDITIIRCTSCSTAQNEDVRIAAVDLSSRTEIRQLTIDNTKQPVGSWVAAVYASGNDEKSLLNVTLTTAPNVFSYGVLNDRTGSTMTATNVSVPVKAAWKNLGGDSTSPLILDSQLGILDSGSSVVGGSSRIVGSELRSEVSDRRGDRHNCIGSYSFVSENLRWIELPGSCRRPPR